MGTIPLPRHTWKTKRQPYTARLYSSFIAIPILSFTSKRRTHKARPSNGPWNGPPLAQLGRQGITRDTLKVGDEVTVVGNPGRTAEDHRLRMVGITRASDGVKFGGNFD